MAGAGAGRLGPLVALRGVLVPRTRRARVEGLLIGEVEVRHRVLTVRMNNLCEQRIVEFFTC